ncbi:MAG: hypothetical protein FWB93_06315, partial [Oscillospiraceae bacterium]|nr:hypothetical protein [Oscillospiraceae bacterium]
SVLFGEIRPPRNGLLRHFAPRNKVVTKRKCLCYLKRRDAEGVVPYICSTAPLVRNGVKGVPLTMPVVWV